MSFMGIGVSQTLLHDQSTFANHISNRGKVNFVIGKVSTVPVSKKSLHFDLELLYTANDLNTIQASRGTLKVYVGIKDSSLVINKGDVISLSSSINPIKATVNPNTFDYKAYLARQNIFHSTYAKSNQVTIIHLSITKTLTTTLQKVKDFAEATIFRYIPDKNKNAVILAMVLGDKTKLSTELKTTYSDTGAIHVLAVSGLHVGIIASILLWILQFFNYRSDYLKMLKIIIVILSIWIYAILTGAAPSVVRASTMFTAFLIGKTIQRDTYIYNILCFTALLLLIYCPYQLFDLGFLFSFLALLGIVFFVPLFQKVLTTKSKFANTILTLIFVATSAQILVGPLSIFTFQKFSLTFWVSGLFVILGAYLILIGSISMIFFEVIGMAIINENILGHLLNQLVGTMNQLLRLLEKLPFCTLSDLYLDYYQIALLYCIIMLLMIFLINKSKLSLCLIGLCIFLYSAQSAYVNSKFKHRSHLTIYGIREATLIDIFDRELLSLKSDNVTEEQINQQAKNYRSSSGFKSSDNTILIDQSNYLINHADILLLVASNDAVYDYKTKPYIDYILLRENFVPDIDRLRHLYDIRGVILDGSSNRAAKKEIHNICNYYKLPVHDTTESAFIIPKNL